MKRAFLVSALVPIAFACVMLVLNPDRADVFYDEDNLFENSCVIVCGIALLFSLAALIIRLKKESGYGFWVFLSIVLIIFIGDDISWGAKYFGFTIHKIGGIDFDGVHDVLSCGIGLIKKIRDYIHSIGIMDIKSLLIIFGSATAILSVALVSAAVIARRKKAIREFFSKNIRWNPFYFLLLALILIAVAMYIDDDNLTSFPHKAVAEETIEIIAALSLLFAGISGVLENAKVKAQNNF